MNILLAGSSGWLGRYLAPFLAGDGHHVVGVDLAPGAHTSLLGGVDDRRLVARVIPEHRSGL